jgi:hypothetical protein
MISCNDSAWWSQTASLKLAILDRPPSYVTKSLVPQSWQVPFPQWLHHALCLHIVQNLVHGTCLPEDHLASRPLYCLALGTSPFLPGEVIILVFPLKGESAKEEVWMAPKSVWKEWLWSEWMNEWMARKRGPFTSNILFCAKLAGVQRGVRTCLRFPRKAQM